MDRKGRSGRKGFSHKQHSIGKMTPRRVGSTSKRISIGPVRQNKSVRKRAKLGNVKVISAMRK